MASPPPTIRAWQYSKTSGGLEKNLKINPSAKLPVRKPNQHLVQVIAAALNPVDYKPAEVALISGLLISKPATPGIDFVGKIVEPAEGSSFEKGQTVFGFSGTSPLEGGALRDYTVTETNSTAAVPDGVDPVDAATIGVAGITAYQSIAPKVKKGDKVFINGGSGGCGIFGIQIAKALGCHVTTACSTANVDLCKSLGADEVVDYKKQSVVEALVESGIKFDHVVDNVGSDLNLYWRCHEYTKPEAVFMQIAGAPTLSHVTDLIKIKAIPSFLGGGKRKREGFLASAKKEELDQLADWMRGGQMKAVIDHRFAFGEVPQAFEKLKTGRAKGKIVVDIAPES
jgi:NADPH:quinone reductase-like Zn-dependent oxidoreductase